MKNTKTILFTAVITATIFSAALFTACTKTTNTTPAGPCAGITCQNGGSCSNGFCTCPTGYTGTYCENKATTSISYVNKTFTPITINANGATSTIAVGASATYSGTFGNTLNITASTALITSTGVLLGITLTWNMNSTFPSSGTNSVNLDEGGQFFFLEARNTDANYSAAGIYVNYNTTAQSYINVSVPNDGNVYALGYFNAYANTEIYAKTTSIYYWTAFPIFTNALNQYFVCPLN